MYYEAYMALDGYIYEREFIEILSKNKTIIISPTTGKEMKVGGMLCVEINEYLEKMYINNPELLELRYIPNENIVKQFRTMMESKDSNIETIISHVEKYMNNKECKFEIFQNDTKFLKIFNHEKGLQYIINDTIYYKCPEYTNSDGKSSEIMKYSKICVLAYDYIISTEHVSSILFNLSCLYGRYDLMIKLYDFNNTYINHINLVNNIDNVFNSAIKAKNLNLDILKFLHEKNPLLYKNKNYKDETPFVENCLNNTDLEIAKWLHSIDETQINETQINNKTIFEYAIQIKDIKLIEFLFAIDKNIYIKNPKKKEMLEEIKDLWSYNSCCKFMQLVAENA